MTEKMNQPSNLWRRYLCGVLVMLMTFSNGMPLTAANAATKSMTQPGSEAPTVTVVAANINNEYLELGLSIQSQGVDVDGNKVESLFQSVGAVLRYDASKLQPVNWTAATTPTTKGTDSGPFQTVLETKKANGNTMATALTYIDQQVGYLYLAAEMAKPQELYQVLPALAGDVGGEGGGTEIPETASGENPPGPPAVEDRFLPVVEPKEDPQSLIPQVVTVRFKYLAAGEKAITEADVAASMKTIDLLGATDAETAIAAASPADGNLSYFGSETAKRIPANAQILQVKKGVSVDSGGSGPADPSSFFPIVFYDWDGVTLLGSKIVAKTDNATEQQQLIEAAMKEMQEEQSATTEQLDGKLWYDDPNLPLTYKKGYTFGKWIDFDAVDENGNEVYTSYGAAVDVKNASKMAVDSEGNVDYALPEPMGHTFASKDYSGITVKAAYYTNDDMKPLTDLPAAQVSKRNYTVSPVSYLQFGGTTNYAISVRIQREQAIEGVDTGVHRTRKLGLRVAMTVKGASGIVYSMQELNNQDDLTATVAVNNQVENVSFSVIDLCDVTNYGGTTNWADGAAGRSNTLTLVPGGGHEAPGFIFNSAIGYFNDQVRLADESGDVSQDIRDNKTTSGATAADGNYTAADFNYNPVYNSATGAAARRRNALANILDMYQSITPRRNLTWDEMQEAIKRGTVWDNGGWTNGFTGVYIPE